jgi:hypothetical protein
MSHAIDAPNGARDRLNSNRKGKEHSYKVKRRHNKRSGCLFRFGSRRLVIVGSHRIPGQLQAACVLYSAMCDRGPEGVASHDI